MQVLQIHGIPRRKNEVEILQSFPEPEAFLYNEHTKQVEAWTIAVGPFCCYTRCENLGLIDSQQGLSLRSKKVLR